MKVIMDQLAVTLDGVVPDLYPHDDPYRKQKQLLIIETIVGICNEAIWELDGFSLDQVEEALDEYFSTIDAAYVIDVLNDACRGAINMRSLTGELRDKVFESFSEDFLRVPAIVIATGKKILISVFNLLQRNGVEFKELRINHMSTSTGRSIEMLLDYS